MGDHHRELLMRSKRAWPRVPPGKVTMWYCSTEYTYHTITRWKGFHSWDSDLPMSSTDRRGTRVYYDIIRSFIHLGSFGIKACRLQLILEFFDGWHLDLKITWWTEPRLTCEAWWGLNYTSTRRSRRQLGQVITRFIWKRNNTQLETGDTECSFI